MTVGLLGCGARQNPELVKLKQRLDEMAQARAADQRRLDDLNNRLFLLEDKVDTGQVVSQSTGKSPHLPVIRIRPSDDKEDSSLQLLSHDSKSKEKIEDPAEDEVRIVAKGTGSSLVSNEDVVYGGEAISKSNTRPVLRVHGSSNSENSEEEWAELDPSNVDEKLGIVPLPKSNSANSTNENSSPSVKVDSDPAAAMGIYGSAMDAYKSGQHEDAATKFQNFISRFPKHSYSDNAVYWLGECYYDMHKYRDALKTFRRLLEEYPQGNKAPGALLKMGFCYIRLKEQENARSVLAQVVEIFPKTEAAQLALQTLSRFR